MKDAAERLVSTIDSSSKGTFKPNREKHELTLALQNPKHHGRCRGKGVVPWKHAFSEDIESYRNKKKVRPNKKQGSVC